ncbi:MAG: hypothetical protein EHM87_14295 [Burkholderiales bacterium]|nr:MAG: hypothetical protein EHM87_14295 [Burkholderiales bacterium]
MRNVLEQWTVEVDGETFTVRAFDDEHSDPPWENSDGHGPVRAVRHRDEKRPGERPLNDLRDSRATGYVYDWQEAMQRAVREGWGTGDGRRDGETARAHAARAVQADYDYLRGWLANDWSYAVIEVVDRHGEEAFLGGVDYRYGDGERDEYVREMVKDMARELIHPRRLAWRAALAQARAERARLAAAWAGWMAVEVAA